MAAALSVILPPFGFLCKAKPLFLQIGCCNSFARFSELLFAKPRTIRDGESPKAAMASLTTRESEYGVACTWIPRRSQMLMTGWMQK
jgi:hypothetical protein